MAHIKKIPDWNSKNPLFRKADHIPATEKPVSAAAKDAARHKDPRIDVLIYKRANNTHYAVIKFYSHVKPNWLLTADVELDRRSERELDFFVGVTCGAMAEQLDEKYGDTFDPEKSARHGSGQFASVLKEWARQADKKG